MNKQTEALKLALEALEAHADIGIKADKAITAIREALAEQPAQQEPEGVVIEGYEDRIIHWRNGFMPSVGTKLYTSPPASKPWVGLTEKEVYDLADADPHGGALRLYRAIEAKLKEKNNG